MVFHSVNVKRLAPVSKVSVPLRSDVHGTNLLWWTDLTDEHGQAIGGLE